MNDELKYTTLATTFLRQLQESGEEFVFASEASRMAGAAAACGKTGLIQFAAQATRRRI